MNETDNSFTPATFDFVSRELGRGTTNGLLPYLQPLNHSFPSLTICFFFYFDSNPSLSFILEFIHQCIHQCPSIWAFHRLCQIVLQLNIRSSRLQSRDHFRQWNSIRILCTMVVPLGHAHVLWTKKCRISSWISNEGTLAKGCSDS
jgi:hypothetical protein